MTTIITRRVNGSGPYAYRVTYSAEHGHQWEYLGPTGKVDPTELDDREIAQLREEGFGLATYRATETHEFAELDAANAIRDEIGNEHLAPTDDRRSTEIELAEDAPRSISTMVAGNAADSRASASGSGQVPLTRAERDSIDFSRTSIMHARSAKAVLLDEGIDDWSALYDHRVSPEAHSEIAAANRESISGDRLDADDTQEATDERVAQLVEAEGRMERRAREACEEGHGEACDELRRIGWTDDEIDALERYSDDAEDFARNVSDEYQRASA
ncbi:hypothetical protein [Halovivax gelatinilyticus]|uniref:hypothetical protein n=1 Tax=Halovivax gelatinilyticus TaxID=2961597 RepID=UPI0020CA4271|nr:hypothetical protein [Halovivax gelatinilyticus]